MSNVKMSVTIELPGSTMMTPQECGENPKNYKKQVQVLSIKAYDAKAKKSSFKKEKIEYRTRKCIPAYQSINMTEEAYEYMISSLCPEWYAPMGGINKWKKLPIKERLQLHLDRTCKSLGGISYTYVVFGE